MRCKYCGSKLIHPATEHKTFSGGKAVAGAVAFGVVGAAAGFIGKDKKGYQCGACGAFMEAAMDFGTELSVDSAIRAAERGDLSTYNYYKSQYANIQANIPAASAPSAAPKIQAIDVSYSHYEESGDGPQITMKSSFRNLEWMPNAPIYVESADIFSIDGKDFLQMHITNQSEVAIRSAYFDVKVMDDTNDPITTVKCVYQGEEVAPGADFPVKKFELNTNIAYKVDIYAEKAAMVNGDVWRNSEEEKRYTIVAQTPIGQDFPRFKYIEKEIKNVSSVDQKGQLFLPNFGEEFWQCVCGKPVLSGNKCVVCGAESEKVNELFSQKRLMEIQRAEVIARATKRADKTMAVYDAAREEIYKQAVYEESYNSLEAYDKALSLYKKIGDYKDSLEKAEKMEAGRAAYAEEVEKKAAEEKAAKEAAEKAEAERVAAEEAAKKQAEEEAAAAKNKRNKLILLIIAIIAVVIIVVYVTVTVIIPSAKYSSATKKLANNDFNSAYNTFMELGDYKDSQVMMMETRYQEAAYLVSNEKFSDASGVYRRLDGYKDSADKATETMNISDYRDGLAKYEAGDYAAAEDKFTKLGDFVDSAEWVLKSRYAKGKVFFDNAEYEKAVETFESLGEYSDSADQAIESKFQLAGALFAGEDYLAAYEIYDTLASEYNYKESKDNALESKYLYADACEKQKKYKIASETFESLKDYKDGKSRFEKATYSYAKSCFDIKDYDNARTSYFKVKDYEDSWERWRESTYNYAVKMYEKREYKNAVDALTNLKYNDSEKLINEIKYKYASSHRLATDKLTYKYLKDLKAINYSDSRTIFKDLYAWKANVTINDSVGTTTNKFSVSKSKKWYVHILLYGGEPVNNPYEEEMYVNLKVVGKFPDGSSVTYKFDNHTYSGEKEYCYFYYNNPSRGSSGDFTANVYDGSGKLLNSATVYLK